MKTNELHIGKKAFVYSEHIVRGPAARIWNISIENISAIKHSSACPTFINNGILCQPQSHEAEISFYTNFWEGINVLWYGSGNSIVILHHLEILVFIYQVEIFSFSFASYQSPRMEITNPTQVANPGRSGPPSRKNRSGSSRQNSPITTIWPDWGVMKSQWTWTWRKGRYCMKTCKLKPERSVLWLKLKCWIEYSFCVLFHAAVAMERDYHGDYHIPDVSARSLHQGIVKKWRQAKDMLV